MEFIREEYNGSKSIRAMKPGDEKEFYCENIGSARSMCSTIANTSPVKGIKKYSTYSFTDEKSGRKVLHVKAVPDLGKDTRDIGVLSMTGATLTQVTTGKVMDVQKVYLSFREAMMYLGVSKDFLNIRRLNGDIPYYKVGHMVWYKKSDLDALVKNNRIV